MMTTKTVKNTKGIKSASNATYMAKTTCFFFWSFLSCLPIAQLAMIDLLYVMLSFGGKMMMRLCSLSCWDNCKQSTSDGAEKKRQKSSLEKHKNFPSIHFNLINSEVSYSKREKKVCLYILSCEHTKKVFQRCYSSFFFHLICCDCGAS